MSKNDIILLSFAKGAKFALPQARFKACRLIKRRLGRDWVYAVPEFNDVASKLLALPELATASGKVIWQTQKSTVWRTQVQGQHGAFDIIHKSRPGRYRINRCVSASTAVRDAINLLAINSLGFPTTELLAVGEQRCISHWQYCFIVTRFAEDFKQVTEILPGEPYGEHPWIRNAVIEASLKALAKLHMLAIYHKAFKPYNIMWKESKDKTIDLCLFDFETSRTIWFESFERYMLRDLFDFFRFFGMSDDTLHHWISFYLQENTSCQASPDIVFKKLRQLFHEKAYNTPERTF